ncbi:MAG: 1-(5-phosphoribosyl)-5-[(5-phosphoribosylamino)methylideneamino]imidazole-4-carboxamide isomerase [Chloroflexi bacterium]|nr:1-(5-phosphoribosyl)-5-[(5-phosphoribosylamino)methylideneamino]imidazole-4-carboxamide isomerase [Chloroflexota bacterium]
MEVIPAIDLRGGRCVRLYQGDFARETVFSDDPVEVACRWEKAGARHIHVVDLDGARTGAPVNMGPIEAMVRAVGAHLQVGGGIRTLETIEKLLGIGVRRVVLGTTAIEDPALLEEACQLYGSAIVVSIDARMGMVAVRGWQEALPVTAIDLARGLVKLGVQRLVYTDISRDGTLSGPNLVAIADLARQVSVSIIASGGVGTLEDIRNLAELGVEGIIVGRALYTGAVDLAEAIAIAQRAGRR